MVNGSILIVDDDTSVLRSLEILLEHEFKSVHTLSNPNQIPEVMEKSHFDLALLDMNFSAGKSTGNEGLYWLKEMLKRDPDLVVIHITAYGDIDLAVRAMKEGATDFIVKPWNNDKLISTIKSGLKLRKTQMELREVKQSRSDLSMELNKAGQEIIGQSEAMKKVMTVATKVAGTAANVLILGENGTGKELVARYIHNASERAKEPMITVDLTSLNEGVFESELFGHVKGAFTDAKTDKTGRFQLADRGTLFLDEIGNLSVAMQAKILTALQNKEIVPLGGTQAKKVDIRLICATNKNLETRIDKGLFREDLYYRINTIQIHLPALRERKEDIPLLADFYMRHFCQKYGKEKKEFTQEALETLMDYDWPGNIRELKHAVEKAVILTESNDLQEVDFSFSKRSSFTKKSEWPLRFEEIERKAILRALANNDSKLTDAAKELGLTRQTLYNKLKKYNISNS